MPKVFETKLLKPRILSLGRRKKLLLLQACPYFSFQSIVLGIYLDTILRLQVGINFLRARVDL